MVFVCRSEDDIYDIIPDSEPPEVVEKPEEIDMVDNDLYVPSNTS